MKTNRTTAFQVGASERPINPSLGCPLSGYLEPHLAREMVNDLYAKALVVRGREGAPVALVSCDVLALDEETVRLVRQDAAARTGIPADHIMVFALHNHTGPATIDIFDGTADREYLGFLVRRTVEAIAEASDRAQSSELHFGREEEDRLSCNRRLIMRDGTVHTHITDAEIGDVAGREGPVDPEVGVLSSTHQSGTPAALAVNFALHPTNVRGDRICSDFPGYLSQRMRAHFGPQVVTLFANGACGNIDSKTEDLKAVDYGPERARMIGHLLGDTVVEALGSAQPVDGDEIVAVSETVHIPLRDISPGDLKLAREILNTAQPRDLILTKGTRRPSLLKEAIYAREMIALAERRAACPFELAEVSLIRIGNVIMAGFPVELFSELGLGVKNIARQKFPYVFVVELANGYLGYVPTRQAFARGGYETRLARSSRLAPNAGEMLLDAAARLLDRV